MQRSASYRMGSWAMNLSGVSHTVAGALGLPMVFASVFALAMTPVKASVVRRKTVGAFHKLRRAA